MRSFWTILGVMLVGCGGPAAVSSQQRVVMEPTGGGELSSAWVGGSPVQTRVVVGSDGQTYVGVWIQAPNDGVAVRAPMAVSLVVDTSGSMSGEKIEHARMAAASFLESLSEGDIVSVYAFNNGVAEIVAPVTVGPATRGTLLQSVNSLYAAGGTNMFDGLTVGVSRLSQAPASHPVRRLVLISDGQANIGPSDPGSLGDLAANGSEFGIQVTAIGVGLDYDEHTLAALAVRSAGRMYHLTHPAQMATILRDELQLLASTVATDAVIEIIPAPGVQILEPATMGATVQGNRMRVPLGALYAGQEREVLFRARIDTAAPGARELAAARLSFRRPGEGAERQVQSASLRYEVVADRAAASASVAPRVQAMVATHEAAQMQIRAAEELNRGEAQAAAATLQRATAVLDRAADAAPAAPQAQRLRQQAQQVRTRASRAAGATSAPAAREAALESMDSAYEMSGY